MAKAILDQEDFSRLRSAVDDSLRRFQPYKEARLELVRQTVGRYYGDNAAPDKVPLNLAEMFVSTYRRLLTPAYPKLNAWSPHDALKKSASKLELACQTLFRKVRYARTLEEAISEAMFGVGVAKVGVASGDHSIPDKKQFPLGRPYAGVVALDDFLPDMNARRWEESSFIGNVYRVPLKEAQSFKSFSAKARDALQEVDDLAYGPDGSERAEMIGGGFDGPVDRFEEMVDLCDVYVPSMKCLVTFDLNGTDATPALRQVKYDVPQFGCNFGCYHLLYFNSVPGNLLPSSPASLVYDLHDSVNRLLNKTIRQAEREKTNPVFASGRDDEAERLSDAEDGRWLNMDTPGGVNRVTTGGASQVTTAFIVFLKGLFEEMGGNLSVLAGLSPQSPTATQDSLISQSANKRVEAMQDRVFEFTESTMKHLAWLVYTDPLAEIETVETLPGFPDVKRIDRYGPDDRTADFFDYDIRLEPSSVVSHTPMQKAKVVTELLGGVMGSVLPMMQSQGLALDARKLLKSYSEWLNIPELEEIIVSVTPGTPDEEGGSEPEMRKPNMSRREYIRTGRSAQKNPGEQSMLQMMQNGANQRDKMAV